MHPLKKWTLKYSKISIFDVWYFLIDKIVTSSETRTLLVPCHLWLK